MGEKYQKLSSFDRSEKFNYKNIPKHFDSITNEGLKNLESVCSQKIGREFPGGIPATAEKSALGIISGEFNNAYAELDGDYNTRRNNLKNTYADGLAELKNKITEFENLVVNHNIQFNRYASALKDATGEILDDSLAYDQREVEKYKRLYQALKERRFQ